MRIKSIGLLTLFLIVVLLLTSCQIETVSQSQLKLARLSVTIKDFPVGWKYTAQDRSKNYGGESYLVAYGVDNTPMIRFTHTVSLYPDEEQAKIAYPKWQNEWFPSAFQKWPGADFVPSDPKDDYRFECSQTFPEVVGCRYLQRHKQFIIFILVNVDNKTMNFAQLNHILKTLDDRLNETNLE